MPREFDHNKSATNIPTREMAREMEIQRVLTGSLVWPTIGWDVISSFQVIPAAELSYLDPIIPPPMNACVHCDVSLDNLLFTKREFYQSGDENSRYITSIEYDKLIRNSEDVSILSTFSRCLLKLHQWKDELETQNDDKSTKSGLDRSGHCTAGIPHCYKNKNAFLDQINHCTADIFHETRFHTDVVKHLHPYAKVEDKYIQIPLVPPDETSSKGMILTNASILESLGLLIKQPNGKYVLGENAKKSTIFLYGDALTVCLHFTLYDKILQQMTQLGNEESIRILLGTQERVFVQKGCFHQQINLLGAIYTQFYGLFMQAFQVSNGVKRMIWDPVKSGFQCQEKFAMKLYNSCN
jgi:hypothetical protein